MDDQIYRAVFRLSEALETPVVALALLALAAVIVELGAFGAEVVRRSRRSLPKLAAAVDEAAVAVGEGRREDAARSLAPYAWSRGMGEVLDYLAAHVRRPGSEPGIAKRLADFDFDRQRRLSRTRLLVRAGPALGLMGTLIPLSPALEGLADGDVTALTDNLRVAFSVTVLGLLIGAVSFGLSLARDRMYGQDYSDLEYAAAVLTAPETHPASDPASDPADDPAGGPKATPVPASEREDA